MIVLYNGYGNHSNRLFQNIHFEAFCIEEKIQFVNPSFADMQEYYVEPVEAPKDIWASMLKMRPARVLSKMGFFRNVVQFNKSDDNNATVLRRYLQANGHRNVFVEGWGFKIQDLVYKYQDLFIKKYALKNKYYENNELYQTIMRLKSEKKAILVGVHIRRGDYKSYKNGKYYFLDMTYEKYMSNLKNEIANVCGKACTFIIFSTEPTSFNSGENMLVSNNAWYMDHLLMSKCDFLIGPPSTFTQWASYIGKTKYFHMTDDSGRIKIKDFVG